jgi:hypothetical protein
MKSVPNWTLYLHNVFHIFIPFLSIFLAREIGFGVSLKLFFRWRVGLGRQWQCWLPLASHWPPGTVPVIATAQGINAPASRQGRSEAVARADRRRPAVRHATASAEPSHHIRHEPRQSSLLDTTQVPRCSSAMPSCEAL